MIKKFKNILEAVQYRTNCPICNEKLVFSTNYAFNFSENNIAFQLENNGLLLLNIDTNIIKLVTNVNQSGTREFFFNIECQNCVMYDYIIKLIIDFKNNIQINSIDLFSERLSVEDSNKNTHDIVNNYTENFTSYTYHTLDKSKNCIMQLLELDFNKQNQIVSKLQKMIIFS